MTVRGKHWTVDLYIAEDEDTTHAEAPLRPQDATRLVGHGHARRSPKDPTVPEIGDELATAPALGDLAHRLWQVAADDIEAATHDTVHLRG